MSPRPKTLQKTLLLLKIITLLVAILAIDHFKGPPEKKFTEGPSEADAPLPDPISHISTIPRPRKFAKTANIVAPEFRDLKEKRLGDRFVFPFNGTHLKSVVQSIVDQPGITHYGIELEEENGRVQMSIHDDGSLWGQLYFQGKSVAYEIRGTVDSLKIEESTVASLMCASHGSVFEATSGIPLSTDDSNNASLAPPPNASITVPIHSSLPGADYVLYLDFDGEVVTHPWWNNGEEIDAQPQISAYDSTYITNVWKRVAEDFIPFNVNVTTDRSAYDNVPVSNRTICIVTATNFRGSGGVAYRNSFGNDVPCWTFNSGEYACADTCSHEFGHTLGLSHDGRDIDPKETYYPGHGTGDTAWGAIMGAPFFGLDDNVTQWSIGEYPDADNQQDDLTVITSNGFGYRVDDHSSSRSSASNLNIVGNSVQQSGIIERNSDVDWFQFTTSGGSIEVVASPLHIESSRSQTHGPNLAIEMRLYDSAGNRLYTEAGVNTLDATLNESVSPGLYYLRVEGASRGNSQTGFSDYASLGQYTLTGEIATGIAVPQILVSAENIDILRGSSSTDEVEGTDFGMVPLGSSATHTFTISNAGNASLTIQSITEASSQFSIASVPSTVSSGTSQGFNITYAPTQTGTASTIVNIVSNDPDEGNFSFALTGSSVVSVSDDNYEENDSLLGAYDLTSNRGDLLTNIDGIGRLFDSDWYVIEATSSQRRLSIEALFTHLLGDIDLYLYNPQGELISSSISNSNDETIQVTVPVSGRYFVRLAGDISGSGYNLRWDRTTSSSDPEIEVRGGDNANFVVFDGSTSTSISAGTHFNQISVGNSLTNRFTIFNSGDGSLSISSVTVSGSGFSISSGSGSATLSPGDERTFDVRFSPGNNGSFDGMVTIANNDSDEGTYTFAVTGIGGNTSGDDAYEQNDDQNDAFNLRSYERVWLSNIDGLGIQRDDDWYAIESSSGENRLLVELRFEHDLGDIDLAVYDTGGNQIAVSFSVTNNESISVDVEDDEIYFLKVSHGNAGNTYDLWWDDEDSGIFDDDNDGLTNAEEDDLGSDPNNPDSDGDGVNDGDEVLAGTDPLDINNFPGSFAITDFEVNGSQAVIRFPSSVGGTYHIDTSSDLAGWSGLTGHTNIAGTGTEISRILNNWGNDDRRFFRVSETTLQNQKLSVTSVLASTQQTGNVAQNTIDGNLGTRWSGFGVGATITFTLSNTATVNAVRIGFEDGDERTAFFHVEVSSNGSNYTRVLSNAQSSGDTLELQSFSINSSTARYVRIIGNGNTVNDWNSLTEVEIFGAP